MGGCFLRGRILSEGVVCVAWMGEAGEQCASAEETPPEWAWGGVRGGGATGVTAECQGVTGAH